MTAEKKTTEAKAAKAKTAAQPKNWPMNGSDFLKGFEDLAAIGKENVDAAVNSSTVLAKGSQDINTMLLGYAQSAAEFNSAAAKAMMGCTSVTDFFEIQSTMARTNFDATVNEGRKITELAAKVTEEAMAPLTDRFNATVEKMSSLKAL